MSPSYHHSAREENVPAFERSTRSAAVANVGRLAVDRDDVRGRRVAQPDLIAARRGIPGKLPLQRLDTDRSTSPVASTRARSSTPLRPPGTLSNRPGPRTRASSSMRPGQARAWSSRAVRRSIRDGRRPGGKDLEHERVGHRVRAGALDGMLHRDDRAALDVDGDLIEREVPLDRRRPLEHPARRPLDPRARRQPHRTRGQAGLLVVSARRSAPPAGCRRRGTRL